MRISKKYAWSILLIAVTGCAPTSKTSIPATQAPESAKDPKKAPPISSAPTEAEQTQPIQDAQPKVDIPLPSTNQGGKEQSKSEAPAPEIKQPNTASQSDAAPAPRVDKKQIETRKSTQPTMPNTFDVTANEKDQSHPFFGKGHKAGFFVNGEPGQELVLTRGDLYKFNIDTGVQHDFYFSTSPVGWGGGTITDGIKGQFTYLGTVTFAPTTTTPSLIYYQCRNHKSMGGKIYVLDKGESLATVKSRTQEANVVEEKTAAPLVSPGIASSQVKQKLAYADMLIASSEAAKRIDASGNEQAKKLKTDAQKNLTNAKSSISAGNDTQAQASVDEALKLMTSATQLISTDSVEVNYETRYKELTKEIKIYEKSLAEYQAKKPDEVKANFDQKKYSSLVSQAESSAAQSNYKEASRVLGDAANMITAALTNMLDSTTVVYDKDFKTPQEEYEYELSRYHSYAELVPIAKQEKQPTASQAQLMDNFVKKAEQIISEGKAIAVKGDYSLAIQAMQAATENIRQALMVAGVR